MYIFVRPSIYHQTDGRILLITKKNYMKTNVVLNSESRELLGRNISVMSKDGFVCITEAMQVLTEKRAKMGLAPKQLSHIMESKDFQEKAVELINQLTNRGLLVSRRNILSNNVLKMNSLQDLYKMDLAYKKGRGEDQRWFINPYLFVMIALELDPEIYATVIIWLTDGFIEDRNMAGDAYVQMSAALYKMVDDRDKFKDYISRVAKAINFIVFNKHEDGIRNTATRNQLNEIVTLENEIHCLLRDEFIKDYQGLIKYMGDRWKKRWGNPIGNL